MATANCSSITLLILYFDNRSSSINSNMLSSPIGIGLSLVTALIKYSFTAFNLTGT